MKALEASARAAAAVELRKDVHKETGTFAKPEASIGAAFASVIEVCCLPIIYYHRHDSCCYNYCYNDCDSCNNLWSLV